MLVLTEFCIDDRALSVLFNRLPRASILSTHGLCDSAAPMTENVPQPIIVRRYKGNQETATAEFQYDAGLLAARGYHPTAQTWAEGSWGCGAFLFAALLCFVLIGFFVFIYMLLVKPDGTLTVTYELRTAPVIADEKVCPRCAEKIKSAAVVCRFCGHEFQKQP
jgi:hypothetical protein